MSLSKKDLDEAESQLSEIQNEITNHTDKANKLAAQKAVLEEKLDEAKQELLKMTGTTNLDDARQEVLKLTAAAQSSYSKLTDELEGADLGTNS